MTDQLSLLPPVDPPAQLTNMRLGLAAMLDCQEAPDGSPRMGLFYGPSGYGKSYAAAFIAARLDAAYVVARSCWTRKSLLLGIAGEIGLSNPRRTDADLTEQIIAHLQANPQPIVVDEMDALVKNVKPVETLRDIHDNGGVPILMIGEEKLPALLKAWDRFDNRILVATPAQPANLADALLLRDYYCQRARVADDLVEAIVVATKGVTRRIVVNLQKAQAAAIGEGRDRIELASWGDRRFATGAVPIRKAA